MGLVFSRWLRRASIEYSHIEPPPAMSDEDAVQSRRHAVERTRQQFPADVEPQDAAIALRRAVEQLSAACAAPIQAMRAFVEACGEPGDIEATDAAVQRLHQNGFKPVPTLCQKCQYLPDTIRGSFAIPNDRLLCAVQPSGPDEEGNCSEFEALPPSEQGATEDWWC